VSLSVALHGPGWRRAQVNPQLPPHEVAGTTGIQL
jgi:hypothetical protein